MADAMVSVNHENLKEKIMNRLCGVDMPRDDAEIVADVLVFADLRGVHSHGSMRTEHYCNRIRQGGMNLQPDLQLKTLKPSVGVIDAQGGHGAVSMTLAAETAVEVGKKEGMSFIGVHNNSHCGALAYYAEKALKENMAAMVFGNTNSCVVPFGGRSPFLGTNPFAFAYPGEKDSVLLDMATSEVAFGKIFYHQEKNSEIPSTWAVDEEGHPVTDPAKAKYLFPFGGPKGYGINLMVEALTGLLVGGVFGPGVKEMYGELDTYRNVSNSIIMIDPSVFHGRDFLKVSQRMFDQIRAIPPGDGFSEVLLPGDIERRAMEKSLVGGIEIPQSVYNYLFN